MAHVNRWFLVLLEAWWSNFTHNRQIIENSEDTIIAACRKGTVHCFILWHFATRRADTSRVYLGLVECLCTLARQRKCSERFLMVLLVTATRQSKDIITWNTLKQWRWSTTDRFNQPSYAIHQNFEHSVSEHLRVIGSVLWCQPTEVGAFQFINLLQRAQHHSFHGGVPQTRTCQEPLQ